MRNTLFASATLFGMALALPALAQTSAPVVGPGSSEPTSTRASNIDRADARSDIAPALPIPPVGPNADPRQYLTVADSALRRNRTGEAQEALERAETRLLDRSTNPDAANTPDQGPMIQQITDARNALARGDRAQARQIIASALSAAGGGSLDSGASGTSAAMGAGSVGAPGSAMNGASGSMSPSTGTGPGGAVGAGTGM